MRGKGVLPELEPGSYGDKDLEELSSTLASLENAVVVLGSVFELERSKLRLNKKAQKLIAQCKASATPKNWLSRSPLS